MFFGNTAPSILGLTNNTNPGINPAQNIWGGQHSYSATMSPAQQGNLYSQQLAAQASLSNQSLMQSMMNQQMAGLGRYRKSWMVNGEAMTFAEFLDAVCPDADDPHRTYLTLKYKGME